MQEISKLQKKAADKLSLQIVQQSNWVQEQESKTEDIIFSDSNVGSNGYNLRQHVQALVAGKGALEYLLSCFKEYVGIEYKEYAEQNQITVKEIKTPEQRLLDAIKEVISTSLK